MENLNRRGMPWKPEHNIKLIELWGKYDLGALSHRLNRSENALVQQARKLSLPPKPRRNASPIPIVEYIRANAKALTGRQLAQELGIPQATVYSTARRYGIAFK